MGRPDMYTKIYMQDRERFADVFNFYVYDGEPVIHPENLQEMDAALLALPGQTGKTDAVQKYRDLLDRAVIMTGEKAAYLLLGIENQSRIHYAMPVKNAVYDLLQYEKQIREKAAQHRQSADRNTIQQEQGGSEKKKPDSGEYLSGFYREDRLTPVITIVIYFGTDRWDGPKSLHDMMEFPDEKSRRWTADYRINLIEPAALEDADFSRFATDFCQVMKFLKLTNDKDQMRSLMEHDPTYRHLRGDAASVLNVCAGLKIPQEKIKGEMDMCQAWKEMGAEREAEGRQSILYDLVRDGEITIASAARRAGQTEEEFAAGLEQYLQKAAI